MDKAEIKQTRQDERMKCQHCHFYHNPELARSNCDMHNKDVYYDQTCNLYTNRQAVAAARKQKEFTEQ